MSYINIIYLLLKNDEINNISLFLIFRPQADLFSKIAKSRFNHICKNVKEIINHCRDIEAKKLKKIKKKKKNFQWTEKQSGSKRNTFY